MNVAEARAAGILRATPEEAWGNAAIPGFGIGRPTRPPELDPGADRPALAARRRGGRGRGAVRDPARRARPRRHRGASPRDHRRDAGRGAVSPGREGARRARRGCARHRLRDRPRPDRPGHAAVSPLGVAALFAVLLLLVVGGFFLVVDLQRGRRAAEPDRQGLGQRRGVAPPAPRPAAGPRRCGPRRDGLRAGGPRGGYPPARPLRPRRAGSRAGRGLRRDDGRRALALRRRRAVPAGALAGERPSAAGRDRAPRRPDRRPPGALQRPGLPLQHDDRPGSGGRPRRAARLGARGRSSTPATRPRRVRTWPCGRRPGTPGP